MRFFLITQIIRVYSFIILKFQRASAYLKEGEIPLFESRSFYIRRVHILATSTRRGVDEKDLGAAMREVKNGTMSHRRPRERI